MNKRHIEQIFDDYRMIAIIIRDEYSQPGIAFFTPDNFSQQLAGIRHPKGHIIPAHIHKPVPRTVKYTQETLFIKKGKVKVTFYNEQKQFLETCTLKSGDVILLVSGGHDFEMLEDTDMIEVKQGPYAGEDDKERFEGIGHDSSE
jgi:mannose-6-phosphate isomerase-like protein (cupin superfamily)